ncbi:single-strand binding protein [Desulfotomaculum arcticum]|uniref:Single-stranded DNA-binding protein n=1 Tax=Desulfotruncus arcticus DSM 17038 TaxID=1121424 RepID=A0A1I2Z6J2_9FIRM|nr:single-strand binding protein [Desulfotomaculum arcticum] [Desulfotruncus arcticus DSM 17038]
MMNEVWLIGRLTKDPEEKKTPNGKTVARMTLAVDRDYTNTDGERETDFIEIIAWEKLAENCIKHLGKGRLVSVKGRLQIRTYDDSQGTRRKAAEVVAEKVKFLDKAKENA